MVALPQASALSRRSELFEVRLRAGGERAVAKTMAAAEERDDPEALCARLRAQLAPVVNQGRWTDFAGASDGKHRDCAYFSTRVFPGACTATNLERFVFAADVYAQAQQQLRMELGRRGRFTQTADARMRWVRRVALWTSLAHWATAWRPAFLWPIQQATAADETLNAWGPPKARALAIRMWEEARSRGKELMLPFSLKALFRFSDDPGIQPPWYWMTNGQALDTQALAELKRGQRRRERRHTSREGAIAREDWFKRLGTRQVTRTSNGAVVNGGNFESASSEWGLYEIQDDYARQLYDPKVLAGRQLFAWNLFPDKVVVASGELVMDYVQAWAESVVETDYGTVQNEAFLRYLAYMRRFPVQNMGMTLEQIDKLEKAAIAARGRSTLAIVGSLSTSIAGQINYIAGIIVAIAAAVAMFFQWLFGGAYRGCPKAPRPPLLRSMAADGCSIDVATSDRSQVEALQALETAGGRAGYDFPSPFRSEAEAQTFEAPPLDFEMPALPPADAGSTFNPVPWLLGAAGLVGGAFVLRTMRS